MTQRFRQRGPDLWTPLIRLTEAITMLDMAGETGQVFSKELEPIRERLLTVAKHPRSVRTSTSKGDPS